MAPPTTDLNTGQDNTAQTLSEDFQFECNNMPTNRQVYFFGQKEDS